MQGDASLRRAFAIAVMAHAGVLAWLSSTPVTPLQRESRAAALVVRQVSSSAPVQQARVAEESHRTVAPAISNPQDREVVPHAPVLPAGPLQLPADPEYLPRGRLSVPPSPIDAIDVPFPDDVTGTVDLRVHLAVFIDSAGAVQRVRLDTEGVPPAFAREIEKTFLAARFTPGERDGRSVASVLRLEVEFASGQPR